MATDGFTFDNFLRNAALEQQKGFTMPAFTKTGTTIVGVLYGDGVVLGADTRATSGSIVADKNCAKIHYLAPNIYCCGAGTAADTEFTTDIVCGRLELHRMNSGRPSRVVCAMTMLKQYLFRHQGHIGAALVLGGVDAVDGPQLYTIHPHGSVDKLPFVAMGSGSLAAMAVLESQWRPGMSKEDAMRVVQAAIESGIYNDLGSGSNVDLCIIQSDLAVDYRRNHHCPPHRPPRQASFKPARGTTRVISESAAKADRSDDRKNDRSNDRKDNTAGRRGGKENQQDNLGACKATVMEWMHDKVDALRTMTGMARGQGQHSRIPTSSPTRKKRL